MLDPCPAPSRPTARRGVCRAADRRGRAAYWREPAVATREETHSWTGDWPAQGGSGFHPAREIATRRSLPHWGSGLGKVGAGSTPRRESRHGGRSHIGGVVWVRWERVPPREENRDTEVAPTLGLRCRCHRGDCPLCHVLTRGPRSAKDALRAEPAGFSARRSVHSAPGGASEGAGSAGKKGTGRFAVNRPVDLGWRSANAQAYTHITDR